MQTLGILQLRRAEEDIQFGAGQLDISGDGQFDLLQSSITLNLSIHEEIFEFNITHT
jgi:hypothetical protein